MSGEPLPFGQKPPPHQGLMGVMGLLAQRIDNQGIYILQVIQFPFVNRLHIGDID